MKSATSNTLRRPGQTKLCGMKAMPRKFDPEKFLTKIGEGRRTVSFHKKETVFAQGTSADSIFYIQVGTVKLTVVSKAGKEATVGILNPGDFFGESCLAHIRRLEPKGKIGKSTLESKREVVLRLGVEHVAHD